MTWTIELGCLRRAMAAAMVLVVAGCPSEGEGPFSVAGSARLPNCTEDAALDLDGHTWIDRGTITTSSAGCLDAEVGDTFTACTLQWVFSQQGREVEILVDNEYVVAGRLCGDELHLEGGWWIPVADEHSNCTYEDDSASEVGIEQGGSTLVVTEDALSGTLRLQGECAAEYEVTFSRYIIN